MRDPSPCAAGVNVTPMSTDDGEALDAGGSSPAPPPTYAKHVARVADGVSRYSGGAIREGGGVSDDLTVKMEFHRKRWALFLAGNLISAAVVISEIWQLSVCFHEFVFEADDDDNLDFEAHLPSIAQITRGLEMFTLFFGLWTEIVSAIGLSLIYRSPLDIKSVHKIPPEDMRHCGGTAIVYFLAPFSWGVIYMTGSVVSALYSVYSFCEGRGGSGLTMYLWVSSAFMYWGALAMLGLSFFILLFSCGSPARCADRCCAAVRRTYVQRILSKASFLDFFWQVQGALWSYRAGGFGLTACILVGVFGIVGQVLAGVGSLAPDVVREVVGPLP